ncbi:hypothetical protein N9L76_05925 [bacterium]|nr:hypothetical protein [bacterium]
MSDAAHRRVASLNAHLAPGGGNSVRMSKQSRQHLDLRITETLEPSSPRTRRRSVNPKETSKSASA